MLSPETQSASGTLLVPYVNRVSRPTGSMYLQTFPFELYSTRTDVPSRS